MKTYEEMLKRAMEKLPKRVATRDRFEIPQVVCEIHGSKSMVKNFVNISNILRRDQTHLSKFLFKELATAGSVQDGVLIFQGNVSREKLQKKIEEYAKNFVYCKECRSPDTELMKEDRITFLKCEACGAKHPTR